MPDLQPWRNPRPAPDFKKVQPRLRTTLIPAWLRDWWPALFWAGVIFVMSTDTFSSGHTEAVFSPLIRWFYPAITAEQFYWIHHYIRKSAHFIEYFIFYLLIYRGLRGSKKGWRWTWGLSALTAAVIYSALDEIHQAFVASRSASAYDSLLDSIGAFIALAVLFLWFRLHREHAGNEPSS